MKTANITLVFLIVVVFSTTGVHAQGGIFGGGGNVGSIFDGIRRGVANIFDSLGVGVPGGAVVPGVQPAESGDPVVEDVDTLPPSPDLVKQIKLSFEWDALSMGGEAVAPVEWDPLLGQDNTVGITDPRHFNPDGLPDLRSDYLLCPKCGGGTSLETTSADAQVLAAQQPGEPPRPPVPPPGGEVITPWLICPMQTECVIKEVERVLTGWCGQDPQIYNEARVPDVTLESQPGPNMFALPNAVSNKYVRRDGYAYKCVRSCEQGSCVTDNYVEFQTAIYPSNAVSLYLKVENPTALDLENVLVRVSTLSYSPQGEYPLPHNIDFPIENLTAQAVDAETVIQTNGHSYSHASTLGDKVDRGLGTLRTITTAAGPIEYSILRNLNSETQDPELIFGPFNIPAAGEEGSIIELPLQPALTEYQRIPDTLSSYDGGELGLVNPATPCECKGVRLHRGRATDSPDCSVIIPDPTDDQCRLYYGIATRDYLGNNVGDHAGGYICDQGGITVEGCPPPWCFQRPPDEEGTYDGPLEACPGGQKILLPANWDDPNDPWYYRVNFDNVDFNYNDQEEGVGAELVRVLEKVLPSAVMELYRPTKVQAFGCTQPCQNDPPPGLSGVGGIIPRDYNFICDPDDKLPGSGEMYEQARCEGTDPQVLLKPFLPDGVTPDPRFQVYRDVTGIGGCGYYASSDNSVIGPIQAAAEYGAEEGETVRPSRSVIVGSIPVGGRILDDQARPYGWPVTGQIEELWGFTGEAAGQGSYRSDPGQEFGEYRYCAEGQPQKIRSGKREMGSWRLGKDLRRDEIWKYEVFKTIFTGFSCDDGLTAACSGRVVAFWWGAIIE